MSRIGNKIIQLPSGVEFNLQDSEAIIKGKLGQLTTKIHPLVSLTQKDGVLSLLPADDSKTARSMWGTMRNVVNSMVEGVNNGFKKNLEINGVGYRAQVQGSNLIMQLGYSHDINFPIPEGIKISCPKNTSIVIEGIDKQQVGQVAAEIRRYRKPEPYKGKGIKYEGEYIVRKEGKKK